MKKLILTVALGVACASAFAQGQLNFANFGSGANAPVYDTDGTTKLAGSAFTASLWWGPGTVTDSSTLTLLASTAFASSGFFLGGSQTINGQAGGAAVTLQVRVWDTASGSSWASASVLPGARVGESSLFSLTLTSPPTTPSSLTGMTSFHLSVVPPTTPEPSTLALAGVGLAGMLMLRRRK